MDMGHVHSGLVSMLEITYSYQDSPPKTQCHTKFIV